MDDEEQVTELAITATSPVSVRVPELNTLVFLPTREYANVPAPPGYVPWLYPKKKYGALQNPFNGTFINSKACLDCKTIVRITSFEVDACLCADGRLNG